MSPLAGDSLPSRARAISWPERLIRSAFDALKPPANAVQCLELSASTSVCPAQGAILALRAVRGS